MSLPRASLSLSDFPSSPPPPPPPPPPPLVMATLLPPPQPQHKSHSLSPSILIIALILTLVFLVSVSIHLLLRFFSRVCHHPSPSSTSTTNPPPPPTIDRPLFDRHQVPSEHQALIDSLPIFSFDSVATAYQKSAPDCAVCLSRFDHHDRLRLLPNCCHAFHSRCIDAWLASNLTCPLCRSSVNVDEAVAALSSASSDSFRLEIGSVSRRESGSGSRRSYSMGSFDYVMDDDVEAQVVVPPAAAHRRGGSDCPVIKDKEEAPPPPPGADVADAVGGRGWLREYVDRLASSASSSFSSSFRRSGRGLGSSRRSDGFPVSAGMSWDMDRAGEDVGHFFRWLTGT